MSLYGVLCRLLSDYLFQDYTGGRKQLDYFVHFTPPDIVVLTAYKEWMERFGPACTHVLLNGSGPALPLGDLFYSAQRMMNSIAPKVFPTIYPDFRGIVDQVGWLDGVSDFAITSMAV